VRREGYGACGASNALASAEKKNALDRWAGVPIMRNGWEPGVTAWDKD
jgi:hypothetical protein